MVYEEQVATEPQGKDPLITEMWVPLDRTGETFEVADFSHHGNWPKRNRHPTVFSVRMERNCVGERSRDPSAEKSQLCGPGNSSPAESSALECARGNGLSRVLTQQGLESMFGAVLRGLGAFRFTAVCAQSHTPAAISTSLKSEPPGTHPLPGSESSPTGRPLRRGLIKAFPSAETLRFGDRWSV